MSSRSAGALVGVAAGALGLAVAELGSALLGGGADGGTASPLVAVAGAFIDRTPAWLKDVAITTFGTNDKAALAVGMAVVLTLLCALIGVVSSWAEPPSREAPGGPNLPRLVADVAFGLLGLIGVLAVASRPHFTGANTVPTIAGTAIGLLTLHLLSARLAAAETRQDGSALPAPGAAARRTVLAWAGGLTVIGALGILAGRTLGRAGEVVAAARARLGRVQVPDPVTIPPGVQQQVPGQTAYLTAPDRFYRVDTAITVPQVDPATWRLRVTGLVDREVEWTFEELLAEDLIEALVTLTCVSNRVGGSLVGNAIWTGLPTRQLLARAGVHPGADMVLSRSVDGFTAGTPLVALTDERHSLLAVAQNRQPLLPEHGFPARLVVPGLYGYVSATKWVTELKVTRFDLDEGYWTPRGWSARGPIKTASRIDVPRDGQQVNAGVVVIAGVAWAPHRGIKRVEVRIGEGPWQEATLAVEPAIDSWRQWKLPWQAEPGEYAVSVRATDGAGELQTAEHAPPAPDGASGWHTITVRVEGS